MIIERSMQQDWLSNAYLVGDEENGKAVVIDSGGPSGPLLEAADKHGLDVELLLLTHHHGDHVAENSVWKEQRGVEILAHPIEAELIDGVDRTIEPGDTIEVGGLTIESVLTPGSHRGDAQLRRERHGRVHGRHALQGLGRRRAGARLDELRGPAPLDHGRADEAAARDARPSRAHRPDDDRRRVGVERVRAALARARRGGDRELLGRGRAGDARALGARTTTAATRPGCAGRTGATTSCPAAASSAARRARAPDRPRRALPAREHVASGRAGRGPRGPQEPARGCAEPLRRAGWRSSRELPEERPPLSVVLGRRRGRARSWRTPTGSRPSSWCSAGRGRRPPTSSRCTRCSIRSGSRPTSSSCSTRPGATPAGRRSARSPRWAGA